MSDPTAEPSSERAVLLHMDPATGIITRYDPDTGYTATPSADQYTTEELARRIAAVVQPIVTAPRVESVTRETLLADIARAAALVAGAEAPPSTAELDDFRRRVAQAFGVPEAMLAADEETLRDVLIGDNTGAPTGIIAGLSSLEGDAAEGTFDERVDALIAEGEAGADDIDAWLPPRGPEPDGPADAELTADLTDPDYLPGMGQTSESYQGVYRRRYSLDEQLIDDASERARARQQLRNQADGRMVRRRGYQGAAADVVAAPLQRMLEVVLRLDYGRLADPQIYRRPPAAGLSARPEEWLTVAMDYVRPLAPRHDAPPGVRELYEFMHELRMTGSTTLCIGHDGNDVAWFTGFRDWAPVLRLTAEALHELALWVLRESSVLAPARTAAGWRPNRMRDDTEWVAIAHGSGAGGPRNGVVRLFGVDMTRLRSEDLAAVLKAAHWFPERSHRRRVRVASTILAEVKLAALSAETSPEQVAQAMVTVLSQWVFAGGTQVPGLRQVRDEPGYALRLLRQLLHDADQVAAERVMVEQQRGVRGLEAHTVLIDEVQSWMTGMYSDGSPANQASPAYQAFRQRYLLDPGMVTDPRVLARRMNGQIT